MTDPTPWAGQPLDVAVAAPLVVQVPPRVLRTRLVGLLFDTDRTFLLPTSTKSIRRLKGLYASYPGAEILVVGHADRAGAERYNVRLSEERAKNVAAYLADDVERWLGWYHTTHDPKGEYTPHAWDAREDKSMLSALADDQGPLYAGPIDAQAWTKAYTDGVRRFQALSNRTRGTTLKVDGAAGDETRRQLIGAYMDLDGTTLPAGTVLATHGCGEYHPVLATADGVAEQQNRRTEVFFFEEGIAPPPQDRCPRPGCAEYAEWLGRTVHTIDLRDEMPEVAAVDWEQTSGGAGAPVALRLLDRARRTSPFREAVVLLPDGARVFGQTDKDGVLRVEVPAGTTSLRARWSPTGSATAIERALRLDLPPPDTDDGAAARLDNLGYRAGADRAAAARQFQADRGLPATGALDAATRAAVADAHDGGL